MVKGEVGRWAGPCHTKESAFILKIYEGLWCVLSRNNKVTFALEGENMTFRGWLEQKGHWSESKRNEMLSERGQRNRREKSSNCFLLTLPPGEGREEARTTLGDELCALVKHTQNNSIKTGTWSESWGSAVVLGWKGMGRHWHTGHFMGSHPDPTTNLLCDRGQMDWPFCFVSSPVKLPRKRTLTSEVISLETNVIAGTDSGFEGPKVETLGNLSLKNNRQN